MGSEFDFRPRVERGACSLAELIRINYRMEEVMGKRRRTIKPAKSYRDALQAGYPGIDASSEATLLGTIKSSSSRSTVPPSPAGPETSGPVLSS